MYLFLVRNVKFSAAECNSFNMRKKFIGDFASKKLSGECNAKKHPLGCKVTTIEVQSSPPNTAYLYSLSVYLCSFEGLLSDVGWGVVGWNIC